MEPHEVLPPQATLAGSLAVVTGSSSGIGQGIACMFAAEGARVAGLDIRDGSKTKALAGDLFTHHECDLAEPTEIADAFSMIDQQFETVPSILCCVAGIAPMQPFLETTTDTFDEVMAVNVRAPFLCGQEAARRMRAAGGGRIINIASTASVQAWTDESAYGASKGALALLTKCMAVELAPYEIVVNAIGPGSVRTPLASDFLASAAVERSELERTPLGRLGTPADIAATVRFLARDSSWLTGQVIYVDGGFLATGLSTAAAGRDH